MLNQYDIYWRYKAHGKWYLKQIRETFTYIRLISIADTI